jgi:hypothetical protein
MLDRIIARFSCDACGAEIEVELDAARKPPLNGSLYEAAEDGLRAGGHGEFATSVQNDRHLCGRCTVKADKKAEREECQS